MIVDSSALVAIALREAGYDLLIDKLSTATQAGIGAPTLIETAIVLSARLRRDARGAVARMIQELAIEIVPFADAHYGIAVDAWLRFGKGHLVEVCKERASPRIQRTKIDLPSSSARRERRQRLRRDPRKASKVSILGQQGSGAVLEADGGDLRIEDQVAARTGRLDHFTQQRDVTGPRREQARGRTLKQRVDRIESLEWRGRRREHAWMRNDADELADAEDRQSPGGVAFGECT